MALVSELSSHRPESIVLLAEDEQEICLAEQRPRELEDRQGRFPELRPRRSCTCCTL